MPTQDFDVYHTGSPGPPQGWVVVASGSGSATYNQDVQGGTVTLSTGTTQFSKVALYLDSNIVIPAQEGSYQIHIASMSTVGDVTVKAGFTTRAQWNAFCTTPATGSVPTMAAAAPATDYLLHDFDDPIGNDWTLWYQLGAAGGLSIASTVAAVTTTTKLIAIVDQGPTLLQYVNGTPTRSNTLTSELTTALVSPGVLISNEGPADMTVTIDSITWEGRRS